MPSMGRIRITAGGKGRCLVSHPSDKNKDVARMGHPASVSREGLKMQLRIYSERLEDSLAVTVSPACSLSTVTLRRLT